MSVHITTIGLEVYIKNEGYTDVDNNTVEMDSMNITVNCIHSRDKEKYYKQVSNKLDLTKDQYWKIFDMHLLANLTTNKPKVIFNDQSAGDGKVDVPVCCQV